MELICLTSSQTVRAVDVRMSGKLESKKASVPRSKEAVVANIDEAALIAGIAESLEVDISSVSIDTVSSDLEEWDSLGHISIMSYLDKTYGDITERVPDFASATSVREVLELLKSHVQG